MLHATVLTRLNRPDAFDEFNKLIVSDWPHLRGLTPQSFYDALAEHEVARRAFREFVRGHIDDPSLLYAAARIWESVGYQHNDAELRREALATWTELVAHAPSEPQAWFGKAEAQHQLGDLDGAVKSYERSLELWPEFLGASARLKIVKAELDAMRRRGR